MRSLGGLLGLCRLRRILALGLVTLRSLPAFLELYGLRSCRGLVDLDIQGLRRFLDFFDLAFGCVNFLDGYDVRFGCCDRIYVVFE